MNMYASPERRAASLASSVASARERIVIEMFDLVGSAFRQGGRMRHRPHDTFAPAIALMNLYISTTGAARYSARCAHSGGCLRSHRETAGTRSPLKQFVILLSGAAVSLAVSIGAARTERASFKPFDGTLRGMGWSSRFRRYRIDIDCLTDMRSIRQKGCLLRSLN
ncbi:hypothetical protein [Burkholderia oklahomensis]|uniref:hypothetical protein n=1 Tax=Burkholderia oklahomensis TaxID=342113 RepID=UPI000F53BEC5|nr:hypothetical protein [Burkholderia oklahomensis]MBI0362152.1 hypothetical protein [Burkholderia oklahomensis]